MINEDKNEELNLIDSINNSLNSVKSTKLDNPQFYASNIRSALEYAIKLFWIKRYDGDFEWGKHFDDIFTAMKDERFSQCFNSIIYGDMHTIRKTCNEVLHRHAPLTLEDSQDLIKRLEKCLKAIEDVISMRIIDSHAKIVDTHIGIPVIDTPVSSKSSTANRVSTTYPYENMKIGQIAQTILRDTLENGNLSDEEIYRLQTLIYSKKTFDIQFPLLVPAEAKFEKIRYYRDAVYIKGKKYYICSQWYESPKNNDRPYLLEWIKKQQSATTQQNVAKDDSDAFFACENIDDKNNIDNEQKMTKATAISLFLKAGYQLYNGNTTFASKNKVFSIYWANPDIDVLNKNWYLILNDNLGNHLYLFNIPENAIPKGSLNTRSDLPNKIDLRIFYGDLSFRDQYANFSFAKFHIKTIDY